MEGDLRPFSCKKPSHTKLDTSVPFRLTVDDTRAEHPRPPQSSGPQHAVPSLPLTHKAKSPYTPTHLKQVLITSPHLALSFPRPIPAMNSWGELLLFLILAGASVWEIRCRRQGA